MTFRKWSASYKVRMSGCVNIKQGGTAGFSCPGKEICGAVFVFLAPFRKELKYYVRKEDPL